MNQLHLHTATGKKKFKLRNNLPLAGKIPVISLLASRLPKEDTPTVLEQILERITDGYVELDETWCVVYANAASERMLNLNRHDYLRRNLWESFPYLVETVFYEQYHLAMREKKAVYFESFLPYFNIWVEVNVYPSSKGISVFLKDVTQRKKTEEELTRLSLIARETSNLVIITCSQGKVTWVNNAFVKKTGYTFDELEGKYIGEMLRGPETNPETENYIDVQSRMGLPFQAQILNYTKTKEKYWTEINAQPVYGPDGNVSQFFAIQTDITDRKNAEAERMANRQKIIAQNKQLAGILEHMNQGFFMFDLSHRIHHWNGAAADITGIPSKTAVGAMITSLFQDKSLSFYLPMFQAVLKTGRPQHHEYISPQINKWIEMDIYPSEDGISVFFKDVDQRKRTEAELNKLSLVARETKNAVLILAPDETITWVNAAFSTMTGYSFEEAVGNTPADLMVGPLTNMEKVNCIRDHFKLMKPVQVELLNYRKDGEIYWAETSVQPVFDEKGNLQQFFCIQNDITERKRMEAELAAQRKQTTAAVIAAQENERSFVSRELHDSVNPVLTTIKLYQEMILQDECRRTEYVAKSKELLQQSISEIRRLSKKLSIPMRGLYSFTDSVKELVQQLEETTLFAVEAEICDLQTLQVSEEMHLGVYRILQEHITNIIKHADAKRVRFLVTVVESKLLLTVTDDGKGFDPQQKRSGIGLNNMQMRAEQLNGLLCFDSSPGKGCKLMASFPLAADSRQQG
ncbi:MAG: PAS domain S-box protein [Chitinophagaceae bacterium]|nr:MAG: PAS domain S-box protein [Chitinophagaceae bacterium]